MANSFDIVWTDAAVSDLDQIVDFIAQENPKTAQKILDTVREQVGKLADFPLRGRVVPEFEKLGLHLFREMIIPPWRIVFRVTESHVYILAVIDTRQCCEEILFQRLLRFCHPS